MPSAALRRPARCCASSGSYAAPSGSPSPRRPCGGCRRVGEAGVGCGMGRRPGPCRAAPARSPSPRRCDTGGPSQQESKGSGNPPAAGPARRRGSPRGCPRGRRPPPAAPPRRRRGARRRRAGRRPPSGARSAWRRPWRRACRRSGLGGGGGWRGGREFGRGGVRGEGGARRLGRAGAPSRVGAAVRARDWRPRRAAAVDGRPGSGRAGPAACDRAARRDRPGGGAARGRRTKVDVGDRDGRELAVGGLLDDRLRRVLVQHRRARHGVAEEARGAHRLGGLRALIGLLAEAHQARAPLIGAATRRAAHGRGSHEARRRRGGRLTLAPAHGGRAGAGLAGRDLGGRVPGGAAGRAAGF
jgi:hypothetical protein